MAPQHIQWGTTILILDNEAFRKGYLGGPLAPEEAEQYRKEQTHQEALRWNVPA